MRPDDSTADDWFVGFLDFGVDVLSLVCLNCSVIWGLVAQDRILLSLRQRIPAQAVHRTTAVASISSLLVHAGIEPTLDHTTWIATIVPLGLALTDDEVVPPPAASRTSSRAAVPPPWRMSDRSRGT